MRTHLLFSEQNAYSSRFSREKFESQRVVNVCNNFDGCREREREREYCLIGTAAVVVFLHEIRPLNSSYRAVLVAALMVLHLWCQLLCIFGIHFAYYKEFMCEHAFTWNFFFKNVQNLVIYLYIHAPVFIVFVANNHFLHNNAHTFGSGNKHC